MNLTMDLEQRLDRIEQRLDALVTQLTDMGRFDERLISAFNKIKRHEQRLDQLEDEQREHGEELAKVNSSSLVYERAGWILFAAGVSAWVKFL